MKEAMPIPVQTEKIVQTRTPAGSREGLTTTAQTTYPKSGDIFMAVDTAEQQQPKQQEAQKQTEPQAAQPLTREEKAKLEHLIRAEREQQKRLAEQRGKKLEKYQQELRQMIAKKPLEKWTSDELKKEIEKATEMFKTEAGGIRADGARESFWKQLVGLQRPIIDELKDRLKESEKEQAEPRMPVPAKDQKYDIVAEAGNIAGQAEMKGLKERLLKREWYSQFTQEELRNPHTRSTIEKAIELGFRPESITSKRAKNISAREVVKNALLEDKQTIERAKKLLKQEKLSDEEETELFAAHKNRLDRAKALLGVAELTKEKQLAILRAHYTGEGGVFNYEKPEVREKVKILAAAGFTKDQWDLLIEAGIAATPIGETFNDAFVQNIREQYNAAVQRGNQRAIDAGKNPATFSVDEEYIRELRGQLNVALGDGRIPAEGRDDAYSLIDQLNQEVARQQREMMEARGGRETNFFYLSETDKQNLNTLREGDTPGQTVFRWLNEQMDTLYQLTSRGNELSSPYVERLQQKFNDAYAYVQELRVRSPELGIDNAILRRFSDEWTSRFQLLVVRTTMGHEDIERIQGAVRQLGAKNLLLALALDNKNVNVMFNELQRKLEDRRLRSNFFHITNEDIYTYVDDVTREQKALREKHIGIFAGKQNDAGEWIKPSDEEITRTIRTAADVLMVSQRQAVIITRGNRLPEEDVAMYLNDPLQGPFWVYAMEDFMSGKYRLWNLEQQKIVARMQLGMANQYIKDHPEVGVLTPKEKLELGQREFRNVMSIMDYFSGGYRNKELLTALNNRFSQAKGNETAGKDAAREFALFIRLRNPDLSDEGNPRIEGETDGARDRRVRTELLHTIRKYRPEEIIAKYRERASGDLDGLYGRIRAIMNDGLIPDSANMFDEFKKRYATALGIVREKGYDFKREGGPRQLDFSNLPPAEREAIIKEIGKTVLDENATDAACLEEGQKAISVMREMQNFLTEDKINALFTDFRFSDVFTRAWLVDDAFLPELEQEEAFEYWTAGGMKKMSDTDKKFTFDGAGDKEIQALSKTTAATPAGDGLVRSYNDVKDGITAGQGIVKFIREGELDKKMQGLLPAVDAIKNANGNDDSAMLVRFTLGEYLNLAKQDWIWDIPGVGKLWFRTPSSDLERIVGPHGKPMSRDELRGYVDQIRDLLTGHASELTPEQKNLPEEERWKIMHENYEAAEKYVKQVESLLEITAGDQIKLKALRFLFYALMGIVFEAYHATGVQQMVTAKPSA